MANDGGLAVCRAAPGSWTAKGHPLPSLSGTITLPEWPTRTNIEHACNGPKQKHLASVTGIVRRVQDVNRDPPNAQRNEVRRMIKAAEASDPT